MTLSSTQNRVSYAGNGVTTAFSFPYLFLQDADLVVIQRVDSTGVETVKTLTTHYTVTGEGNPGGGTVTMLVAPPTGQTLVIYRDPAITQDLDLVENDPMPAEEIEQRFDKLTMIAQRLEDRASRTVELSDGFSDPFDTTLPALLTADTTLKINATADGFDLGPTVSDIQNAAAEAAAAAASAAAASASASAASTSETNAAASEAAAAAAAVAVFGSDVVFKTFADSPLTIDSTYRGKLVCVDATGGNVAITLPQISGLDLSVPFIVGVKKTDATGNTVTTSRAGSDTIDGGTSFVLSDADSGAMIIPDTGPSPDEWTTLLFGGTGGGGGGGGELAVTGSKGTPQVIVAGTGIAYVDGGNARQMWFIEGSGGTVDVTANPQVAAAGTVGRELVLSGTSNANAVYFENGNGLKLNGPCMLGQDDNLGLVFDGSDWVEMFRSN